MQLHKAQIAPEKTGSFSKIFLDYISGKLNEFAAYSPTPEGISAFIKKNKYEHLDRNILVAELQEQNAGLKLSPATQKNIEQLKNKNAYTITTGHQLCLATGPLYFIYKIISVINICETLNKKYPQNIFVPVYWMASEDHDFEEVNHINLFNKKFSWSTDQKGRVGDFSLENVGLFLDEIKDVLGENENAKNILSVLKTAYSQKNLAEATRYLVNELFGRYGIVILDGNSKILKQQFIPEIKKDIFENYAFKTVNNSIEQLKKKGQEAQVTPREINFFYAGKNFRERIVLESSRYKVLNTNAEFTKAELEKKIETETENFSPNVVTRPLYQQKILPNAAYVGGPGELAYWLEYKAMFEEAGIAFPVLIPRNFVLYIEKGLQQRIEKLNLNVEDFFVGKDRLIKDFALKQQPFDLEKEKEALKRSFDDMKKKISSVDKTLEAATEAELQKNLKSLEQLEQKAVRAIKQKSEQSLNQVEAIHARLFPGNVPQERVENILRFWFTDPDFIRNIKTNTSSFTEEPYLIVLREA